MVEVEFTLLLQQAAGGCRDSADRVFTIVYDQLRSLAARQMAMKPIADATGNRLGA